MAVMRTAVAAAVGTAAFALLFGVPRRYYAACALTGAAGWLAYSLLLIAGLSPEEATLVAALLVATLSLFFAVRQRCPATVFLIAGIFPLVPGAGIYWTAYYLVTDQMMRSLETGELRSREHSALPGRPGLRQ